jgi:hypothetical protein
MAKTRDYPTLADLTKDLRAERDAARNPWNCADPEGYDIRLQVVPGEGWSTHCGDPSYDQDHRGYWGAGMIRASMTVKEVRDLARDLLDQARDMQATCDD